MKEKVALCLLSFLLLFPAFSLAGENALLPGDSVRLIDGERIDLDGNGVAEEIRFSFSNPDNAEEAHFTISVNNLSVSQEDAGLFLTGEVWALRVIGTDDTLLLTGGYDSVSEDRSHVYHYDGTRLVDAGVIASLPQNIRVSPGMFTGWIPGHVLHAWYRPADFVVAHDYRYDEVTGKPIASPKIVEAPRALYPMGTQVTAKCAVSLLTLPERDAPVALTLALGENAVLSASDDKAWIYIEALGAGREGATGGWLFVGFQSRETLLIGDQPMHPSDVFDGLRSAN